MPMIPDLSIPGWLSTTALGVVIVVIVGCIAFGLTIGRQLDAGRRNDKRGKL